jgi:tetratricopeptide (TPR) repeat protein
LIERAYKTLGDRSLKSTDRLTAAEKLFRQALALDPRSGKACLGLGLCLASSGIDYQRRTVLDPRKASEALAMTNQAAELNPQLRAEAHAQLACFNMWLGQYVEESREREQAVELASNNLRYREALGIAYWNAGVQANTPDYFNRAVREFQAIVRDDPEYPKVREYIKLLQERFLTQPPGQVHVSLGDRVR